jgi:hypothetical protein
VENQLKLFLAFAMAACSGSDSPGVGRIGPLDAGPTDGAIGIDSPGAVLAHESNALIKQNFERRCAVCPPCGAFQDVGPVGDTCGGIALDRFPDSKGPFLCRIEAERRFGDCLRGATDCAGVGQCDTTKAADVAKCPVFMGDTSGLMLPPECTR